MAANGDDRRVMSKIVLRQETGGRGRRKSPKMLEMARVAMKLFVRARQPPGVDVPERTVG